MSDLVVGFDLDMTLIDTRPGFAATLDALGAELDIVFDTPAMVTGLGPPLSMMLEPYLPADRIDPAVDRFRELYVEHSIVTVPLLPGAAESLTAVRELGGRIVVVTGKFARNAQRHLDHLAIDHDELVGEVWGAGKGPALREHGCAMYVGDHVHDVEAARAARILSVSIASGGSPRADLEAAGTDVLLDSLSDFPAWLRLSQG